MECLNWSQKHTAEAGQMKIVCFLCFADKKRLASCPKQSQKYSPIHLSSVGFALVKNNNLISVHGHAANV